MSKSKSKTRTKTEVPAQGAPQPRPSKKPAAAQQARKAAARPSKRKKAARVLLVDDTVFMRRMLRDILTKEALEVAAEAGNGKQAVEAYQQTRPDLVIMDITMPLMDGIAAVREIIAEDPAARIVMCSALGQQELIIEALEAGARDFVVKPFVPAKVMEAVRKTMGAAALQEKATT